MTKISDLAMKIAKRYSELSGNNLVSSSVESNAVCIDMVNKYQPLNLEGLLSSDEMDFRHDMNLILQGFDLVTKDFKDEAWPRFGK